MTDKALQKVRSENPLKGYLSEDHKKLADFFFDLIMQGRVAFHTGKNFPSFSGGDFRHTIQSHGFVFENYLTMNGKGLSAKEVDEALRKFNTRPTDKIVQEFIEGVE